MPLADVREMCAHPSNGFEIRIGAEIGAESGWSAMRQEEWCNACYDEPLGVVWDYTNTEIMLENVHAMLWTDHIAFMLCTVLVAMSVVGELKDIELCEIALGRAASAKGAPLRGWRRSLYALTFARRWSFLPGLCCTIPALIVTEGGGALSVCLNTVSRVTI
jgi:hypothetical protein